MLALNFGVPADPFKTIPLADTDISQGALPGPIEADQDVVKSPLGPPPNPFVFPLASAPYAKQTRGGNIKIVDGTTFKASTTTAAALVTVHPGGMRDALASECRRVAVLHQGIGPDGGVQDRAEGRDDRPSTTG